MKEQATGHGHVTRQLSHTHFSPASLCEVSALYFLSLQNPLLLPTNRTEETISLSHYTTLGTRKMKLFDSV